MLGIGVNVAVAIEDLPAELAGPRSDARARDLGGSRRRVALLAALERRLGLPDAELLDAYRALDALLGREIAWAEGTGIGAGIAGDGCLRVRLPDGSERSLGSGEVHLGALPPD